MVQTRGDSGKHRNKRPNKRKVFQSAYCLRHGCGGYISECMQCYIMRWLAGYRRLWQEESNWWLSTIPILNVFGRLERRGREGKGKGEKRYGAKRKLSPSCSHVTQKAADGCVKTTACVKTQGGQNKLCTWTLKFPIKNLDMNSESGVQRSSITAALQRCGWGACFSHLSETVRLRGAERLVGQLQHLLRTLQGLGAGAQLTLIRTPTLSQTEHACKRSQVCQENNWAAVFAAEVMASFESHGSVLRLQRPQCSYLFIHFWFIDTDLRRSFKQQLVLILLL